MSNSGFKARPARSVAAFLWMPQLHLSTRHLSYLYPVLVQTLASAFASAGLLPRNHPALYDGQDSDGERYRIGAVIGEAWFNLRSTKAKPGQWGLFCAIALMFALMLGSVATFVATVAFGIGTTAQAQLFTHPLGDSSFNAQNQYSDGATAADPFDKAIPPAGTPAGDFGIMMLDKAIRAGANGQGGPLQRATQDLMLVYNSGILVIASLLIFWMIVTIVVDTAKTGQVGGGRHNMVWVPIRIVLALALLIPLGSNGYSSGQYMVMKLAEWGSNFGSRAWSAYAQSVATNTSMIVKGELPSMSDAVYKYTQMWVCRISVNAHRDLGSGSSDPRIVDTHTVDLSAINGQKTVTFTNSEYDNLCGSFTYRAENSLDLWESTQQIVFPEDLPIRRTMYKLQSMMETAYAQNLLDENFTKDVRNLACKVVGGNTAFNGYPMPECGEIKGTGEYPTIEDQQILERLIKRYETSVTGTYNAAYGAFDRDVRNMADIMTVRGWAGMGLWYHRISQLSGAVFAARNPANIMSVGSLSSLDVGGDGVGGWLSRKWNGTDWAKEAKEDLEAYENWWRLTPKNAVVRQGDAMTPAKSGQKGVGRGDVSASAGGTSNLDIVISGMGLQDKNNWIAMLDNADPDVYPLAELSSIGNLLFNTSAVILAAILGVQAAASIYSSLYDVNNWAVWPFITQMALIPLAAGAMLKYYVPMIPFIRVIFSILTWIISVFEAVVMVPIAGLAHLSSQGEGLAPGSAEAAWKLWLNILLRPILTVIGFVGAMLVFNAFVTYINGAFLYLGGATPGYGSFSFFQSMAAAFIYTFVIYTTANTVFKMMDVIPDALSRWYGVPKDHSFDNHNESGALLAAANTFGRAFAPSMREKKKKDDKDDKEDATGVKPTKGVSGN